MEILGQIVKIGIAVGISLWQGHLERNMMRRMQEQRQRELNEAQKAASESAARANRAEAERTAAEERARQSQEDARRHDEEARQARERAAAAEREQQASDEDARRFRQEANERAKEARQSRQKAQQADEERHEADERARRFQREAEHNEEEARKARDDLKNGIRPDVWPTPEQFESTMKRYGYTPDKIHIAVAGISGCGKSSLVNSFRGLSSKHPLAAKVGIVECTTEVTRYPDPDPSKPIIWFDVPGAGTLDVSDWDYFNDQGLFIFDAIVVVLADRFCATDIAILKACKKYCIPAFIVRSKSDQYIRNMMDDQCDGDEDEDEDEEVRRERACAQYAETTRRNVNDNLGRAGLPDQEVFLISRTTLLTVVKQGRGRSSDISLDEERLMKELIRDGIRRRFQETPALASVLSHVRDSSG